VKKRKSYAVMASSQAAFKKFVPEPKAQDSLAPQRTVFVSGFGCLVLLCLVLTCCGKG
jgi:hypothetical protein